MGFDGIDMEVKLWSQIEDTACIFPLDNIEEVKDEPGVFIVKSQSTPDVFYWADLKSGTCKCRSFPLIKCCMYLAAIYHHFYEDLDIKLLKSLFLDSVTPHVQPTTPEHAAITTHALNNTKDAKFSILAAIPEKLHKLAVRTQLTPPHTLSPTLLQLDSILDELLSDHSGDDVLPLPKKVAPNTGSWHKTEAIMGTKLKTKCESAHMDTYSGGQASGKKAKKDARIPLEQKAIRYVHFWLFQCLITQLSLVYYPARKISLLQHHHIPPPFLQLPLLILYPRTALATAIHLPMPILLLLAPLPLKLLISTITPSPPHPITSYTPRMPMDTHLALPWTILPQTCPTVTPITLYKTIQPYLPSLLIHPHHTHLLITLDINPYPLPCIIYLQKAPSIHSLPLIHNFCHTIPLIALTSIDIASTYCLDLYLGHLIHS